MPFEYVSVEEAIATPGLRMVVVGGIPSPWSEAAKGIFAVKNIEWTATRLAYDDPSLSKWIRGLSAPALVVDDAPPKKGWTEILLLAEHLAPEPALVPSDAVERTTMMGLCHELMSPGGLCWSRRLQSVHTGLTSDTGFAPKVAGYLAKKYGYHPDAAQAVHGRVLALLAMFAERLKSHGGDYLLGDAFTAADIYLATTMALFVPLPREQCPMLPPFRAAYELLDDETKAALDPALLQHRDRVYERHLELPLSL